MKLLTMLIGLRITFIMNQLDTKARAQILHLLCEGNSMRSVARIADVSQNTVAKLLVEAGQACVCLHNEYVQNVKTERVQCDEIWSFTDAKQKNVANAKSAPDRAGDTWTWTALDSDSKLIVSWMVGGRDASYAKAFMDDVASRLAAGRFQLTTDGLKAYQDAVEGAFGADVDFAQLVKLYGVPKEKTPERKYSPSDCIGTRKYVVSGQPNLKHISTSHVERQNLTMRMHMRRFTRLTNGFSKKFENHIWMVSLYSFFYNFLKIHKTLRVTPAMEARLTDHVWTFEDIVERIDRDAPKSGLRVAKRNANS